MPSATATSHAAQHGFTLDSFGRTILSFADYRVVGLAILVAVAIFTFYKRRIRGRYPHVEEYFRIGEACGLIATGLVVGCVFLLTNPPAVDELSHEGKLVIGLVTVVLTLYFGVKTIRDTCDTP